MAIKWWSNFLEWLFPVDRTVGGDSTVVIDIPAELYYKELAVFTQDPNLTLEVKNYVDLPQFRLRSWQGNRNILYKSEEYEMFVSRLCCNLTYSMFPDALGRRLEHGFYLEYGGGHNLSTLWLPKKEFGKSHPEYYMMINVVNATRRARAQLRSLARRKAPLFSASSGSEACPS